MLGSVYLVPKPYNRVQVWVGEGSAEVQPKSQVCPVFFSLECSAWKSFVCIGFGPSSLFPSVVPGLVLCLVPNLVHSPLSSPWCNL